ncbi:MAG: D-alanine--D-alanine ligase family protein [Gammaproteobacteria bacterium]
MSQNQTPYKYTVGVIFGGQSGEHAISLLSAASIINHLDKSKYHIIAIGITQAGDWYGFSLPEVVSQKTLNHLLTHEKDHGTLIATHGTLTPQRSETPLFIDVFFPAVHGPLCEDGTLQGFLETLQLPYVGPDVLASAIAMHKGVAKDLVQQAGIATTPYTTITFDAWQKDSNQCTKAIAQLGYPVFVKPANMGSSVGIHKVNTTAELSEALEDALQYDHTCIVEKALNVQEIELSILENLQAGEPPLVSIPGEIVPHHDFYSYEAKYIDPQGAALIIPANITPEQQKEAQGLAANIFHCLRCNSMARVDLFLEKNTGKFYFNELNTLPGFTDISMYPKLWEHSGMTYSTLLDHLLQLALQRHQLQQQLKRDFHHG